MRISVFGLGYVGCVSAACFAKLGHQVIGVDVVQYKVDSINGGEAPIQEKNLTELVYQGVKKFRLSATTNTKKAVLNSDISFVCVGTPPKKNGDLDLFALKRVCEEIGLAIKEKENHLVVIRSTMFPGSLNILRKILEKSSGKKSGKGFGLAVNPEFLREGSAIKDFFNPPMIVIGSDDKKSAEMAMSAYNGVKAKKFVVKENVAQMIKYASNSWHALKVSFANEIGSVCNEIGVDASKLMGIFTEDNQLNISSYYMKPGFAYGGSCLPKDLAALKNNANKTGLKTPVIDSISESNLHHILRAVKLVEKTGKKKIGILGITFKADTDDIRGNPILYVINRLVNKGYNVKIYDPLIGKSNLKNIAKSYRKEVFDLVNRENLKESVADISGLFGDVDSIIKQDVVIVSSRDESLKKYVEKLMNKQILVDLQKIFSQKDTRAKYLSLL